ncbi:hypothetical protein HPP92_014418 [Vanilla planifolia]|uniref:Uncharacterized protein n=1 Tax=Vanilla planifolia TaxID=51239 RepID=A0A835QKF5_VANPL|nr:hypothetical protein HPP92_014418 [Vanilla planifolia]
MNPQTQHPTTESFASLSSLQESLASSPNVLNINQQVAQEFETQKRPYAKQRVCCMFTPQRSQSFGCVNPMADRFLIKEQTGRPSVEERTRRKQLNYLYTRNRSKNHELNEEEKD